MADLLLPPAWPCAACTFSNPSQLLYCQVCGTPRPPPTPTTPTTLAPTPRSRPFNVFAFDAGSFLDLARNVLRGGLLGGLLATTVALLSRGRVRVGVLNAASVGVLVGASYTEVERMSGEVWTVQDPESGEIRRVPREMVSEGAATHQEIFGVPEGVVQGVHALPVERLRSKADVDAIPEHSRVCCICMDGYRCGDEVKRMPCEHVFHGKCLDRWLYRAAVCPLCNRAVDAVDYGRQVL